MDISSNIIKIIEEGKVYHLNKKDLISDLEWNAHPKFKGVFLKHLVKGADTNNKFSAHIVKVEAGCEIGEHVHEINLELHEILEGDGIGFVMDKEIKYNLGTFVVIPENIKHKVIAKESNLYLFAKFFPALV